jgi:hypothetical protein
LIFDAANVKIIDEMSPENLFDHFVSVDRIRKAKTPAISKMARGI